MWQAIRTFFGSSIGKIGGVALKVWHVTAAVTIVAASAAGGAYAYTHLLAPTATPQRVVIFISGLNTTLTNCAEPTFTNSIQHLLGEDSGIANPYLNGCHFSQDYHASPTSMALYSYVGGHMDTQHGIYVPNDYDPSNVNNLPIQTDVQGFDHMLDQYRQVFPQATFIIIGHSLGGLVALQGAYDYAVTLHHPGVIDKVLTVDAPLAGILTGSQQDLWLHTFLAVHGISTGQVETSDLLPLGQQSFVSANCSLPQTDVTPLVALSQCAADALIQAGVGVVTLGNRQDSLFCSQTFRLSAQTCSTQVLPPSVPAMSVLFNETPLPQETVFNAAGHGTLLMEPPANLLIIHFLLAPVVTIAQPVAGSSVSATPTGVAITYSATVHCLWGAAQHATAYVEAAGSQNGLFAGTATPTALLTTDVTTLSLNGVVSLPSSLSTAAMQFYVDASGNACAYPAGATLQPTKNDYYGGAAVPVAFTVAQGSSGATVPTEPPKPSDAATQLAASSTITANAGDTFTAYFDELNTGNTTWSDAGGYQLICNTSVPGTTCMSDQPTGLNGAQIAPGQQAAIYVSLTAPATPGTYKTAWTVGANGKAFASGSTPITVKVNAAPAVYIGDSSGVLHALDANTRQERWHFPTGGDSAQVLAVANGIVYVGEIQGVDTSYVTSTVYALSAATGAALWHIDGVSTSSGFGTGNVLTFEALDSGLLYLELGNTITAFDAQTGHQKWQYGPGNDTISAFALSGATLYIAHDNQGANPTLDAVNTTSGSKMWSKATTSPAVANGVAADASTVYVAESDGGPGSYEGNVDLGHVGIEAFRGASGDRLWHYDGYIGFGIALWASSGHVYVTLDGMEGAGFAALDVGTGSTSWTPQLDGCNVQVPSPAQNAVYDLCSNFNTQLESVAALDPATGHVRWHQTSFGTEAISHVSVSDGIPYAWGNATYALDPSTGSILWHHDGSFSAAGDGFAAVAASNGTVTVLNSHNGSAKWSFPAGQQNWPPFVFIAAS